MTWGPRIQISPSWLGPRSSPLATSTTLHSVLGSAGPTDPGITLGARSGTEWLTGLVSVRP